MCVDFYNTKDAEQQTIGCRTYEYVFLSISHRMLRASPDIDESRPASHVATKWGKEQYEGTYRSVGRRCRPWNPRSSSPSLGSLSPGCLNPCMPYCCVYAPVLPPTLPPARTVRTHCAHATQCIAMHAHMTGACMHTHTSQTTTSNAVARVICSPYSLFASRRLVADFDIEHC